MESGRRGEGRREGRREGRIVGANGKDRSRIQQRATAEHLNVVMVQSKNA